MRRKYKELKRKVRGLHKFYRQQREDLITQNEELRDTFKTMLLDYKAKMEKLSLDRDAEIETELYALKRRFDNEIERLREDRNVVDDDFPSISTSSRAPATSEALQRPFVRQPTGEGAVTTSTKLFHQLPTSQRSSSDEENSRPRSKSEQMASIFAEVAREAKIELKRPTEALSEKQRPHPLSSRNSSAVTAKKH